MKIITYSLTKTAQIKTYSLTKTTQMKTYKGVKNLLAASRQHATGASKHLEKLN